MKRQGSSLGRHRHFETVNHQTNAVMVEDRGSDNGPVRHFGWPTQYVDLRTVLVHVTIDALSTQNQATLTTCRLDPRGLC